MAELLPGRFSPLTEREINARRRAAADPAKKIHCDMTGIANCMACGSHFRVKTDEKFCRECIYWQQFMPRKIK